LFEYAVAEAAEFRVVRLSGTESEAGLPFAALHHLCSLLPINFDQLPPPQHRALRIAFGLEGGDPPDSFLVGLASLSLLSAVAEDKPLLCLIDDAQWLDQASRQVLAFVARRLEADAAVLIFATRVASAELGGIPEIHIDGLSPDEARKLLDTVIPEGVTPPVRDKILKLANGNPLAILEIPRGLSAIELAVDFAFGGASGELHPAERSFTRRIATLPADTQVLLLVAAVEPEGSGEVVWRAAKILGLDADAIIAAERAGLAQSGSPGGTVAFRHPLVRSAVYRAATFGQRRAVHQALAEACDPEVAADRRAWHRALAAIGPDEDIAAELERSAAQAVGRGGLAAAAALLGKAVELTPDPSRRYDRALTAASAAKDAGDPDVSRHFLDLAPGTPLTGFQRARKQQLEAQLAYITEPGQQSVSALIEAAANILPFDLELARETYLEALSAAIFHTSSDGMDGWVEIAKALRNLLDRSRPFEFGDLMVDAVTTAMIDGDEASAPLLKDAVQSYMSEDISDADCLRWWQLGWLAAAELWDPDMIIEVIGRTVKQARVRGALAILASSLFNVAICFALVGDFDRADGACQEGADIMSALGQSSVPYPAPVLAAHRGVEFPGTADGLYGELAKNYSSMLLANGRGRYREGLEAAREAFRHDVFSGIRVFPELIETATRSGDVGLARAALMKVRARALPSGSEFALGMVARCEALLTEGAEAEGLYEDALVHLKRTGARIQIARAHLLYGEWLRRAYRRTEAREHLRTATNMLTELGANAFAERAKHELRATGERVLDSVPGSYPILTPREEQIAELAAQRQTNVEIAAQLFISPRTVDYHLRTVFQKLNIRSRRELGAVMARPGQRPSEPSPESSDSTG
jgi:DNA-binding CsgD family transcriptional regulator